MTSAQAAATLLSEDLPAGSAVFVIGGEGLEVALAEAGLRPVQSVDEDPVAVVSGYSPEELSILVRQFGSYVGEVLLRQAAGDWGVVEMASGERVAGIELEDRNLTLWPWAKVHKRLTEGAKENLQDYAENVLGLRQGQTT